MINSTVVQRNLMLLEAIFPLNHEPLHTNGETIFVFFPEQLTPPRRHQKYQIPLDRLMRGSDLGGVSGGGNWLDRSGLIMCGVESCDVSALVNDQRKALKLLRKRLPALGCLSGTQLQYEVNGRYVFDEYDGTRWRLGLPETVHEFGRSSSE